LNLWPTMLPIDSLERSSTLFTESGYRAQIRRYFAYMFGAMGSVAALVIQSSHLYFTCRSEDLNDGCYTVCWMQTASALTFGLMSIGLFTLAARNDPHSRVQKTIVNHLDEDQTIRLQKIRYALDQERDLTEGRKQDLLAGAQTLLVRQRRRLCSELTGSLQQLGEQGPIPSLSTIHGKIKQFTERPYLQLSSVDGIWSVAIPS